jgi:hypothetical protein
MRQQILSNNGSTASVICGILWFDNMTSYINILNIIQDNVAQVFICCYLDDMSVIVTFKVQDFSRLIVGYTMTFV